ncbi:MAG: hypothetical protein JNL90_15670 [Planctomycetes bacterium]|nr:hypothetical protein [Planctomycetota bacterium]
MENDRNGRERSMAATSGGTTPQPPPAPAPAPPGSGSDAAKCTLVEACSCPLPDTEKGEGMSLAELQETAPFKSGHLRARVLYAKDGELIEEWADRISDPKEWRVVGYGPGFKSYGLSAQDPGYANDAGRKLIEKKFCADAAAGGAEVPDSEKGGVVSVVVKPPGGDGEFLNGRVRLVLLGALVGLAAGLVGGFAIWGAS